MGLRINTNVVSLAAQHRLDATSKKQSLALERLSSGLRINKGSDDVVGLLKSESLRSQLRGVGVALTNISTAKNLLGVAEGTLSQLTSIAQSLREKTVQAADQTISAADRNNLTTTVSDLLNEFTRLVGAAKFDGVSLLDGTFVNKNFQVGSNAGDTLGISLTDTRSSVIGKLAVLTTTIGTGIGGDRATSVGSVNFTDMTGLVLNSVTVLPSDLASDGVSYAEADESAIAVASAINAVSGTSRVTASVVSTVATFTGSGLGYSYANSFLTINGITVVSGQQSTSGSSSDVSMVGSFVTAINAVSSQTGVTATYLDTAAGRLSLTAADGRNIVMESHVASVAIGLTHVAIGTSVAYSGSTVFAIRGQVKLSSDAVIALSGTARSAVLGNAASSVALSTSFTLSQLSVSTSANAETGIFILDSVIRQLQQRRSEVGSKVLRMETAEQELQVRQENLTESESRIRDADIASETANLTAAQILQQAGIQVLQRANALPQVALALLQG